MLQIKIDTIIDKFDVFLLDIFGLIHDGKSMYDGAMDMILAIKKAGKRAIFVSNAPRGAFQVSERLKAFGITPDLYDKIYTPGQIFYEKCERGEFSGKFFAFGKEDDLEILKNFENLTRVDDPSKADWLFSLGVFEAKDENDKINDYLRTAKEKNVKMVCVNPDKIVTQRTESGVIKTLCAGYVADLYEKIGETVYYFGKPHQMIYDEILSYLKDVEKSKIIALGDAFETDIKGAHDAQIPSGLVLTGLHAHLKKDGKIVDEYLKQEIEIFKAKPDFVLLDLTL